MEINHWNGKKWYAYGTSITSVRQGRYVPFLQNLSGMEVKNFGIPGGGITNLGGHSRAQVMGAIMTLDDGKAEADLITLEVGANEGGPLGDEYDCTDESFAGCLNLCIRYLQANTDAQIVVFPSVAGKFSPTEAKAYYERVDKIRRVCEINRVYYLGVGSGLGYARISKNDEYTVDNIHQSYLGGYNLAQFIWSKLKDIPLWYTDIPEEDRKLP